MKSLTNTTVQFLGTFSFYWYDMRGEGPVAYTYMKCHKCVPQVGPSKKRRQLQGLHVTLYSYKL